MVSLLCFVIGVLTLCWWFSAQVSCRGVREGFQSSRKSRAAHARTQGSSPPSQAGRLIMIFQPKLALHFSRRLFSAQRCVFNTRVTRFGSSTRCLVFVFVPFPSYLCVLSIPHNGQNLPTFSVTQCDECCEHETLSRYRRAPQRDQPATGYSDILFSIAPSLFTLRLFSMASHIYNGSIVYVYIPYARVIAHLDTPGHCCRGRAHHDT